jgi:hypothetical protein
VFFKQKIAKHVKKSLSFLKMVKNVKEKNVLKTVSFHFWEKSKSFFPLPLEQ